VSLTRRPLALVVHDRPVGPDRRIEKPPFVRLEVTNETPIGRRTMKPARKRPVEGSDVMLRSGDRRIARKADALIATDRRAMPIPPHTRSPGAYVESESLPFVILSSSRVRAGVRFARISRGVGTARRSVDLARHRVREAAAADLDRERRARLTLVRRRGGEPPGRLRGQPEDPRRLRRLAREAHLLDTGLRLHLVLELLPRAALRREVAQRGAR